MAQKTNTLTIRISNEELMTYAANLYHKGHMPKSKGDVVKTICRLWMNEKAIDGLLITKQIRDFIQDKRCESNRNEYTKIKEKSWIDRFSLADQEAANNVYTTITNGHSTVAENMAMDNERLRYITQKLVDYGALEGTPNSSTIPENEQADMVLPSDITPKIIRLISDEEKQAIVDKENRDLKAMMEQFNNGKALPEEE
jgi:hypothetical protein